MALGTSSRFGEAYLYFYTSGNSYTEDFYFSKRFLQESYIRQNLNKDRTDATRTALGDVP